MEDQYPSQQIELINSQLMATQQQLQHMSERYQDLAQSHVVLLQQVVQLQKFIKNHDGAMHQMMGYLHGVDGERRNSRMGVMGAGNVISNEAVPDDRLASPLQQASELLDEFPTENLPNKELEQLAHNYHFRFEYSTPPTDPGGSGIAPQSVATPTHIGYPVGNDLDNMVYPVGHTNGIDPIKSEHIHNIPYSVPPGGMIPVNPMPEIVQEGNPIASGKKGATEPVWGMNKPCVLLVEDDKMCAKIGAKFLQSFECGVEIAVSLALRP